MKLGIIGAMDVEVNLLKKEIKNLKIEKEGSYEFYLGTIDEVDVIVLLSGIGKVSAAVGTSLLKERYEPNYIINTGTAGGLRNVEMGDLIIGNEIGYHDVDVTAFNYKLGQMAQQPVRFKSDKFLLQTVSKAIQKLPIEQKALQGVILSGDSFMSNIERVDKVREDFPNALAVDMESAAIAQTCKQLNIPFVVVRVISDIAGEGNSKSYDTFVEEAGNKSAKIIINCIEIIKNEKI